MLVAYEYNLRSRDMKPPPNPNPNHRMTFAKNNTVLGMLIYVKST